MIAALHGAEHILAGAIEDAGIMARQNERRIPVEAVSRLARHASWPEHSPLAGLQVAALDGASLAFGIDKVGVAWIDAADKTVAAADVQPVFIDGPGGAQRARRSRPAPIVLQPAERAIDRARIDRYVIELTERKMVQVVPVLGAIVGLVETAVAADDHVPA